MGSEVAPDTDCVMPYLTELWLGLEKKVSHGCGTGKTLLGRIIAISTSNPAYGQVRSGQPLRSEDGSDRPQGKHGCGTGKTLLDHQLSVREREQ